jgi:hypothetical protein
MEFVHVNAIMFNQKYARVVSRLFIRLFESANICGIDQTNAGNESMVCVNQESLQILIYHLISKECIAYRQYASTTAH